MNAVQKPQSLWTVEIPFPEGEHVLGTASLSSQIHAFAADSEIYVSYRGGVQILDVKSGVLRAHIPMPASELLKLATDRQLSGAQGILDSQVIGRMGELVFVAINARSPYLEGDITKARMAILAFSLTSKAWFVFRYAGATKSAPWGKSPLLYKTSSSLSESNRRFVLSVKQEGEQAAAHGLESMHLFYSLGFQDRAIAFHSVASIEKPQPLEGTPVISLLHPTGELLDGGRLLSFDGEKFRLTILQDEKRFLLQLWNASI